MNWKLLGIEETKDKEAITAAYREKLKSVNPEDKPEEFMALRESYEEAMRLADAEEKPAEDDNSPLGLWKKELKDIYDDMSKRKDVAAWKSLLSEDICVALDTRADCEKAMLEFFMSSYYVPQEIWIYLDSEFSFLDRVEELYENYPKDFIDYVVVNGVKLGERLPYNLFVPGKNGADCDEYIRVFNKACRTPWKEMGPVMDEMDALSETHPYGDSMKLRWKMNTDQGDPMDELKALCAEYPGNGYLLMEVAEEYYGREEWQSCEEFCRKALECEDDKYHAKRLLSYSLAKQERFEEGIKIIHEMMSEVGGDRKQLYELAQLRKEWNQSLIAKYEKELEERPEDDKLLLDLAWCYLQNDRNEDCLKLAEKIKEEALDVFDYNNLLGQTYLATNQPEKSLPHLEKLVAYLRELKPDGTKETDRRISRLQEMMARRAACLYEMGRKNEALEAYKEAEEFNPADGETLTEIAQVYMAMKDYENALVYTKKLIDLNPAAYHGYMLNATCNFELRRDRDAYDAINRAISNDGSDLGAYVLKMRILIRNGAFEEAHEVLKFLEENNAGDIPVVKACSAMLFDREDGPQEEALSKYLEVAEQIEKGEYIGFEKDIYYRIANLTAAIADKENRVARKEILDYLEKALKFDPDDSECRDYKAWILKKEGKMEESLEIYKELEKLRRNNMDVERQIAEIYYSDLDHKAADSLRYYEKLLASEDTADNHFYVGMCYFYMDDYENAMKHFLIEQEQEPDVLDGYYRLSMVYEALGRYEEALEQSLKVIDIIKDKDGDQSRYYTHLAQVYRRLRRPYEALDAIKTALDKYGYAKANKDMHEICLQFGLWDEADKVMKRWKVNRDQIRDWSGKDILKLVLKGENLKAKLWFTDKLSVMDQDDKDQLEIIFGSTDKKLAQELRINHRKVQDALKNGWETHAVYGNYAFSLFKAGRLDEAKEAASNALTALEKEQLPNHRYRALYETKKARALALTGRMEEAKHILEEARKLPLCEHCKYPACKDADIFETEITVIEGKYKTALEMCEDFAKQWPGEGDFIILRNYLLAKGLDK